MKNRFFSILTVAVAVTVMFLSAVSVSAIDDKYYITDLKMTVRLPNDYYVITRDTENGDEDLTALNLDYDETMTAFRAADIYLQALNSERNIKISITMTQDQNSMSIISYNNVSSDDLDQVIASYETDGIYTGGEVKKHSGFTCVDFDLQRISESDGKTLYGKMVNSVINGMNMNFTIQKESEQLTAEEEKVLTNMVNNMSFDEIITKEGPAFDWWRVLLWTVIMGAIIFVIFKVYSKHTEAKKKQQKNSRRRRRNTSSSDYSDLLKKSSDDLGESTSESSFEDDIMLDKQLGYSSSEEYTNRSFNDIDKLDISVKEKETRKGIEYFEDGGGKLAEDKDYFESYFTEEVEHRNAGVKAADAAATYTKIGARKVGNFVKNVGNSISGKTNKRDKK